MQELLADDFKMGEEGYTRVYGKAGKCSSFQTDVESGTGTVHIL